MNGLEGWGGFQKRMPHKPRRRGREYKDISAIRYSFSWAAGQGVVEERLGKLRLYGLLPGFA